jgi:zinc transport system substrate-binding protein
MRRLSLLLLLSLILVISGCVSQDGGREVRAVATIAPLKEFVERVGGDRVKVSAIVPPGGDPHTFAASPSQMRGVADADIYIKNGAGLESWMERIIQVNQRMLVVDSSRGVELIGDGQNVDPHIWLSPRSASIQVNNICEGLTEVDPAGRDYYAKNRDDYLRSLSALDGELGSLLAEAKKKRFLVLHPAWSYLARDYGLEQVAIEAEEKEPGPRYLREVVDLARASNITRVFVEPQFNPKMAEVIAREIGGMVVAIDPLAEDYVENMRHVGGAIAESLRA